MSNPQQETKIERVTDAIESLARAVVAHQSNPMSPRACFDHVRDAREEVATALRELLQPTLRIVQKETRAGELLTTLTVAELQAASPLSSNLA